MLNRNGWQSLRGRITILAAVTCIFLAVAALMLYRSVRAGRTATENAARKHLVQLVSSLVDRYSAQTKNGITLQSLRTEHPIDASVPPRLTKEQPAPPSPPERADPLSNLTAAVLGGEEDVQGGFLSLSGQVFGYAASTAEGQPHPPPPLPPRERLVIAQLGQQAVLSGKVQTSTMQGPHDYVLFVAQPLPQGGTIQERAGTAWLMRRIPNANRSQSLQLFLTGAGFGAAALITSLLAWLVIAEVQGGVSAVTQRLTAVQRNLDEPSQAEAHVRLAEFRRLLSGIDSMAAVLRTKIANERALEEQVRHKERLSSLGQFAAGVAHELRNPLATIRLRAQMTQHASGDDRTSRNSNVILEEVDRLDVMISRLLQFARPIALDRQTLELSDLCREEKETWSERTQGQIAIQCEIESAATITGDWSRLRQVLDNLIENAVQASQPGDTVLLKMKHHDHMVNISILDRGSGFDATALTHAMDPFFTTKASGTGLGLSLAFEIVQAHSGELTIKPREGGGAIVSVNLPKDVQTREQKA